MELDAESAATRELTQVDDGVEKGESMVDGTTHVYLWLGLSIIML